jgi:hypothetical protein
MARAALSPSGREGVRLPSRNDPLVRSKDARGCVLLLWSEESPRVRVVDYFAHARAVLYVNTRFSSQALHQWRIRVTNDTHR